MRVRNICYTTLYIGKLAVAVFKNPGVNCHRKHIKVSRSFVERDNNSTVNTHHTWNWHFSITYRISHIHTTYKVTHGWDSPLCLAASSGGAGLAREWVGRGGGGHRPQSVQSWHLRNELVKLICFATRWYLMWMIIRRMSEFPDYVRDGSSVQESKSPNTCCCCCIISKTRWALATTGSSVTILFHL